MMITKVATMAKLYKFFSRQRVLKWRSGDPAAAAIK